MARDRCCCGYARCLTSVGWTTSIPEGEMDTVDVESSRGCFIAAAARGTGCGRDAGRCQAASTSSRRARLLPVWVICIPTQCLVNERPWRGSSRRERVSETARYSRRAAVAALLWFVEYGGPVYTVSYSEGTFGQFPAIKFGPRYRGSEYITFPLHR